MACNLTAAFAAVLALVAGQAFAAETASVRLTDVKGKVMVSRGGTMLPASSGSLKAGDRVVALPGGEARMAWSDGCAVTVKSAAMATVSATSPCAGGQGIISAGASSAQAAETGMTTLQWVGVGLTVVVLGVGIAAAADDLSISN